jgi:hypothetical protein
MKRLFYRVFFIGFALGWLALILADYARAALALDGTVAGANFTTSTTPTATLTTPTAGDIIVIQESNTADNTSPLKTITSISDVAGLTWNKRSSLATASLTAFFLEEVWWAYSPGALTADVITINLSAASKAGNITAFGIKGFLGTSYQTAPWDVNGSLPAFLNGNVVDDPHVTLSTTATDTMVLGFLAALDAAGASSGTGYTLLNAFNAAGNAFGWSGGSEYQVFSTVQTSISTGFAGGNRTAPLVIGDALAQGSASAQHSLPLLGAGP